MKNTFLFALALFCALSGCKKDGDDPKVTVGQAYQGGIVFYVDGTGKHGLIAATSDIGNVYWQNCSGYACGTLVNGANGTAVGTGKQNTIDIVNAYSSSNAASSCDDWVFAGYDDWFLPSLDELKLMYQYKDMIGATNPLEDEYWSSTQVSEKKAYAVYMSGGFGNPENKEWSGGSVRAVRAF